MNKKAILGLLLVGCLSVGAAVGTYAAFKSTASTGASKIKAGKLEINGQRDHAELGQWISTSAAQIKKAGDETILNTVSIQNTGDLNMVVKPNIDLSFTKEGIDKDSNGKIIDVQAGDLNKYMINPVISGLDNTLYTLGFINKTKDDYISLTDFKNALDDYSKTVEPNEKITIGGKMKLDSSADNSYEGTGVSVTLNVTADQE